MFSRRKARKVHVVRAKVRFVGKDLPKEVKRIKAIELHNPENSRKDMCYRDAWRFQSKEDEGELVHGSIVAEGKRFDHAWVDLGGHVWEPQTASVLPKKTFEEEHKPIIEKRYSKRDAALQALATGHYGPWE